MMRDNKLEALKALIEADQIPLPEPAQQMADAIRQRHGSAVRALVFYGSAMREAHDPEKMLDFYVVVDTYASVYANPLLRVATALLPPGVHYLQVETPQGRKLRSKYAVVSEKSFCRRASGRVLESMLWARFVQPTVIDTDEPALRGKLVATFAKACAHFHAQVAPLVNPGEDIWARGLAESYRTELRPEEPYRRAKAIVARTPERYAEMSRIMGTARGSAGAARLKWTLRRWMGKPRGAMRVLKAALTFDGGLDYVLEKVANHSGVVLEVSDTARRHPILHAPVIAWRLYRAGAFR